MIRYSSGAALAALLISAAGAAQAQTMPASAAVDPPAAGDKQDSGDIVVTARKREETVLDVPASVSALAAETLENLGGVSDIGDLGYLVPGITFVNTGNINSEVNIRGAGAGTARTQGVDSPIGVLKDDASIVGGAIGGRTYTRADLFDLERVEVTRGPQGALYGVNAVGGVMNVISARPRDEFGISVKGGYSFEIDEYEGEAILNAPITDTLGVRLGYQHSERKGGHFRNSVDGKPGDVGGYDGGRLAVRWAPSPAFEIYSTLDVSDELSASGRVRSSNFVNDPTGLTPAQIPPPDVNGPFVFTANSPNTVDRDLISAMVRVEADSPLGRLTSISLYRKRTTDFRQDEDGSAPGAAQLPFPGPTCSTRSCTTNFTDDTELFSQELRAQGMIGARIDYLVGFNLNQRNSAFAQITDGRTVSAANQALSPTVNSAVVSKDTEFQYGVFGSLGYSPFEQLTLTLAGRYNHSEKDIDAYAMPRMSGTTACPYTDPIKGLTVIGPPCVAQRALLDASFNNFAPSVSAQFRITPRWQVYTTAAVGYRAGGFNSNSVIDTRIPQSFGSEKSMAYEVGTKFELGGARISLAGFYNDFSDLLVTANIVGLDNIQRNYRVNAGKAETHGVDLEIGGRAGLGNLGHFVYSGAVNWLDGKITSGPYDGSFVEGSPEWTYTVTGIYKVEVVNGLNFILSGSYRAQRGGYFSTVSINNKIDNADVDLVDARVALEGQRFRVELLAQNLLDKTYETLRDPQRSVYADPRTVSLRFSLRFGSEARR